MRLSEAAAITHGKLSGVTHSGDQPFHGVAIDSRNLQRGDLFIAIAGEKRDGHDFLAQAGARGAVGALVAKSRNEETSQTSQLAQIKVHDTTVALGKLGAHWRRKFNLPLIAVTGSNGKTTVSALIAAIFNHGDGNDHHNKNGDKTEIKNDDKHANKNKNGNPCLSPHASFNNQWGVPITLLRMREHHTHAVIEMGMNHGGEIKLLSKLARPDIALINNVAAAHLGGFDDLQGIANAKAEIFSGLAANGTAVLNADDQFYAYWRAAIGDGKVVSFGLSETADVIASAISNTASGCEFLLTIGAQHARIALQILGQHNVRNAIAAAAAATAAGAGMQQIKAGLESFTAINGRLCKLRTPSGAVILDDSYNANPASMTAALDVLASFAGVRIAVLGAMAELGEQSAEFHRQIGAHCLRCRIEHLFCLDAPNNVANTANAAIVGYLQGYGVHALRFLEVNSLQAYLSLYLTSGVTVLIKGSRMAAMERVVVALTAQTEPISTNSTQANTKPIPNTEGGSPC